MASYPDKLKFPLKRIVPAYSLKLKLKNSLIVDEPEEIRCKTLSFPSEKFPARNARGR